ncbi:MAG: glycosyltransferase family 39 protein [Spirochaetia bacterium]|nr:glycosyltransferase family 39 protein [Spirochaetia bacterium]
MLYKVIACIVAVGLAAGQFIFFRGAHAQAFLISGLFLMLGIAVVAYERAQRADRITQLNIAPVLKPVMGIVAAATGMYFTDISAAVSMIFFVASGIILLFSVRQGEGIFSGFDIPGENKPVQNWEPWFFFVLLAVSAFVRMYNIGDFPEIAGGNEGLILGNCRRLISPGEGYAPHIGGGTDWPTFTYYVGIIFGKIFGWSIGNFRLSSALFGVISIATFYFLTRMITSPFAAAVGSVMYSFYLPHIITSRFFVTPVTILLIPQIVCLGLIFAGARTGKWFFFLTAGLACGYSMHGYVPGRGVILIFGIWFLFMLATRQRLFHNFLNVLLFAAGFIIVASPVIYFALKHPDQYWNYVSSVNPTRGGGIKGYYTRITGMIPLFTSMLYTKSACDFFWHIPYKPLLDMVSGTLFSAGIFLCTVSFWKPVPSALLAIFIGGMVPGLLGGGSSVNPNAVRTVLTYPVIFIFISIAVDRVLKVAFDQDSKYLKWTAVAAGIAVAGWSCYTGIDQLLKWGDNPGLMINENHQLYLMGKLQKKNMRAEMVVTPLYASADAAGVYIPFGTVINIRKNIDDMFIMKKGMDYALSIEPFYTDLMPLFRKCFPNAEITTDMEKDPGHPFYTSMKLLEGHRKHVETYVPSVYSNSVYIPASDVADFQTMLFYDGGKDKRVRVFGGSNFAENNRDRNIILRGALLIPEAAVTDVNNSEPVILGVRWPKWDIKVDSKLVPREKPVRLDSGVHFIEISGRVPSDAAGDLPLVVTQGGKNLVEAGLVVAMAGGFGAVSYHTPGKGTWDRPYTYSHSMLTPNKKMYDGNSMQLPFSLRVECYMKVPETGDYYIMGNPDNKIRLVVDGKETYNNMNENLRETRQLIHLTKDKPVKVTGYQLVEGVPSTRRCFTIRVGKNNDTELFLAPYEWFIREK